MPLRWCRGPRRPRRLPRNAAARGGEQQRIAQMGKHLHEAFEMYRLLRSELHER